MATILNSIAILCISIAFIIHLKKLHKPTKFEINIEDLKRANELQKFLEKTSKNVPTSNRNS